MICPRSAVPGTTASAEPWVQVQALSAPRAECGSYKFGARPVPIHSFSASAVAAPWRATPFLFSWGCSEGRASSMLVVNTQKMEGPHSDRWHRKEKLPRDRGGGVLEELEGLWR